MRGGLLIAQGADTCVFDPVVDCTQPLKSLPPGDYVSRLVRKDDREVANQTEVKKAIARIQAKFPDKDIASQFNVATAICVPQLKPEELKDKNGRYCTARQRRLDAVSTGWIDYKNLITPKQEKDLADLPTDFVLQTLPKLLHAIAYLNNENVIHTDAHARNIAKMGDHLVLHDWGRVVIGVKAFQDMVVTLLEDPDEVAYLETFQQWKFPCKLMTVCVMPTSPGATFHRFMKMYDTISILGSVRDINFIGKEKADEALGIASNILISNVHPNQTMPLVHALIDHTFSSGPLPASLEPYKYIPSSTPSSTVSPSNFYTSDPEYSSIPPKPKRFALALPPGAKGGRKRKTRKSGKKSRRMTQKR